MGDKKDEVHEEEDEEDAEMAAAALAVEDPDATASKRIAAWLQNPLDVQKSIGDAVAKKSCTESRA